MLDIITIALAKILKHVWYAIFEVPFEYWSKFINDVISYIFADGGPADRTLDWLEKVANVLKNVFFDIPFAFWERVIPTSLDVASKWWRKVFSDSALKIGEGLLPFEGLDPKMKERLDNLLKEGSWGSIVSAYAFFIPWLLQYSAHTYGIINKDALRATLAQYTPSLPDMGLLINMLFREPGKRAEVEKYMRWLGYNEEQQQNVINSAKPIYDISQLSRLRHREEIDTEGLLSGIEKMGFSRAEAEKLEQLVWYIPPVPDLVRMAVREAFTPEIVDKYGLGEDFPEDFAVNAKKQGLSEEYARHYWSSHWELPSLSMGVEMLHRGVITQEELNVLMRTQDIMPYWRGRLTEISYTPYTRVDIRRMYAAEVLNEEEVLRAYKDIGYDDDKAAKMAEFAIKSVAPKEKDLTKSEVLDAMKKQIISPGECDKALRALGYSGQESGILRLRAFYTKKKEVSDLKINTIKKFFISGVYTLDEANDKLGKLDLKAGYMSDLLEMWEIEKLQKIKRLSASELKEMLRYRVIEESAWIKEMKNLGYSDDSVENLFNLHTGKWSDKKERDLTKGEILKLFKRKTIDQDQSIGFLLGLGYDETEVALFIQSTLYEPAPEPKKLSLADVRKMYKLEIFTKERATDEMVKLNLDLENRLALFTMWESERRVPTQLLSKDDLKSLLMHQVILEEDWKKEMGKIGYSEQSISWLLTLYTGEE